MRPTNDLRHEPEVGTVFAVDVPYQTPVKFHLADDRPATYEGWTDGTSWNGWGNVEVSEATRDSIVFDLSELWKRNPIGTLEEAVSGIDTLPVVNGRVSLAYGYCTTICDQACLNDHLAWEAKCVIVERANRFDRRCITHAEPETPLHAFDTGRVKTLD